LFIRKGTSDRDVFKQIFLDQEYGRLILDHGLIIDCGAYVGYSAAYFLTRYPRCTVFAIEPDDGNFSQLVKNLRPYGKRAILFNAGVWSHATRLAIRSDIYRDGREWTRQVHEKRCGVVEGIDIGALLATSGYRRISLLKMDVEGCEVVIFSQKPAWLSQVDNIAIELHDDSVFGSATNAFYSAIEDEGFQISHSGELTLCRRPGHA
jgi:FkbM family methyltransferase